MGPAIAVLGGILGVAIVILIVLFWKRALDIVLGGGMIDLQQPGARGAVGARMAEILRNPITGYGFDNEGHGRRLLYERQQKSVGGQRPAVRPNRNGRA